MRICTWVNEPRSQRRAVSLLTMPARCSILRIRDVFHPGCCANCRPSREKAVTRQELSSNNSSRAILSKCSSIAWLIVFRVRGLAVKRCQLQERQKEIPIPNISLSTLDQPPCAQITRFSSRICALLSIHCLYPNT